MSNPCERCCKAPAQVLCNACPKQYCGQACANQDYTEHKLVCNRPGGTDPMQYFRNQLAAFQVEWAGMRQDIPHRDRIQMGDRIEAVMLQMRAVPNYNRQLWVQFYRLWEMVMGLPPQPGVVGSEYRIGNAEPMVNIEQNETNRLAALRLEWAGMDQTQFSDARTQLADRIAAAWNEVRQAANPNAELRAQYRALWEAVAGTPAPADIDTKLIGDDWTSVDWDGLYNSLKSEFRRLVEEPATAQTQDYKRRLVDAWIGLATRPMPTRQDLTTRRLFEELIVSAFLTLGSAWDAACAIWKKGVNQELPPVGTSLIGDYWPSSWINVDWRRLYDSLESRFRRLVARPVNERREEEEFKSHLIEAWKALIGSQVPTRDRTWVEPFEHLLAKAFQAFKMPSTVYK